ncbi:hypothetical protein [Nitrosospira sp. Nsp13]|uniref:hypothetical protein n=1 Tax=Nitrosospira sp. Nsp13 TaxID=1855332 RepID=UPI00088BA92B|nr:hypothetical protein [Nitrosospira sp. Nsp13]SCX82968.1 hypothetical protein SAMN05216308_101457 [Nitrosospira sp. Nsp13]
MSAANLHPQLHHMSAATPDAQPHHIAPSHVHSGGHQHNHQHTAECPACVAGRNDHPLPKEVSEMMASREHRMHHWLWHEVRNNWHRYPRDIQQKIDDLGWRPPRPVMDESGNPNLENDSGEDFLYMHRQMIADVNAILKQVGDPNYPRVQGWLEAPPPDDPSYPVPPAWFDPTSGQAQFANIDRIKSNVFYEKRFRFWQKTFIDPVFLRSVTLGKLGVIMEMTIHNAMHMRWAASSGSVRPDPLQSTGEIDPLKGEVIGMEWDDPRYNFLGDTYSSHVNPIFWKLHGWIDDRVEGWKLANGVFGNNFWKGTWTGKMPGHEEMAAPHALHGIAGHEVSPMAESQQVANLIAQTGVFQRNPFMPQFSMESW